MPNEILFTLLTTLFYSMLFINYRMYSDVYMRFVKIDVLFGLVFSSWAALGINSLFNMNFYLILAVIAVLLLGLQSLLYHYRLKKKIETVENRFTDVDSVFKNKIGIIETRELDGKEQQIMVYSDKMLVNSDKFVIMAFEGSKIIVEKLSGTEVVNNNSENNKEEKNNE